MERAFTWHNTSQRVRPNEWVGLHPSIIPTCSLVNRDSKVWKPWFLPRLDYFRGSELFLPVRK